MRNVGLIGSSVLATGLAVTSSLIAPTAQAASLACNTLDASLAGKVTGTSGCEYGSTNNDFLNPLQVNEDNMFGGGWSFYGKDDEDFDFTPIGSGNGYTSGTWDISSALTALNKNLNDTDFMLVFKSGGGNVAPTENYIGYTLSATSGNWESQFLNANNGKLKAMSHMSLYYRDGGNGGGNDPAPVPEPSTMLALGLIGGGMFLSRGRQSH
ncbi:MAG: PEP-CTERM sorting domain-containing protein [Trichodesmium sp.]